MKYIMQGGEEVFIREARIEDAEKLLETARANMMDKEFVLTSPEEFNFTIAQEENWIQSHIENPGAIILVAESESKIVGVFNAHANPKKKLAHTIEFGMGILKEWRNKGIGSILLKEFIDWADKNPMIEKITLQVFSNNDRAIYLYNKFGFKEEGRQIKAIKLGKYNYVDNVLMYRMVTKN